MKILKNTFPPLVFANSELVVRAMSPISAKIFAKKHKIVVRLCVCVCVSSSFSVCVCVSECLCYCLCVGCSVCVFVRVSLMRQRATHTTQNPKTSSLEPSKLKPPTSQNATHPATILPPTPFCYTLPLPLWCALKHHINGRNTPVPTHETKPPNPLSLSPPLFGGIENPGALWLSEYGRNILIQRGGVGGCITRLAGQSGAG